MQADHQSQSGLSAAGQNLSIQSYLIVDGRDNDKTITAARMHFQRQFYFVKPRAALTRGSGQPNGSFGAMG
jgi:hypothetical protein